jgi:hypothetical protein
MSMACNWSFDLRWMERERERERERAHRWYEEYGHTVGPEMIEKERERESSSLV